MVQARLQLLNIIGALSNKNHHSLMISTYYVVYVVYVVTFLTNARCTRTLKKRFTLNIFLQVIYVYLSTKHRVYPRILREEQRKRVDPNTTCNKTPRTNYF